MWKLCGHSVVTVWFQNHSVTTLCLDSQLCENYVVIVLSQCDFRITVLPTLCLDGHTVKFYCSHCGILSTGWSHCEIFSTGWLHCEVLLFTLWNIIHRVATLWNSIVHSVEYYPQGGHAVKFYCSHCGIFSTGWPHCEIIIHNVSESKSNITMWTLCGKPHCGGVHTVNTLCFTESNMWTHCGTLCSFRQGGYTRNKNKNKYIFDLRSNILQLLLLLLSRICEHTVGHCVLSGREDTPEIKTKTNIHLTYDPIFCSCCHLPLFRPSVQALRI